MIGRGSRLPTCIFEDDHGQITCKSLLMRSDKIISSICFMLQLSVSSAFAVNDAVNFMLDESGNVIQMNLFTLSRRLALNKSFPLEDSSRGLMLIDYRTGKTITKFKPTKDKPISLLYNAYALDSERVVLGAGATIGIWNRKTNDLVVYRGTGSGESGHGLGISGVHPDLRFIISSSPTYGHGLYIHDLKAGSKTQLFKEYEVMSPRFSPDGRRYAFFGKLNRARPNEQSVLIIQEMGSEERHVYQFDKGMHGVILSWSPSGKYLAGIHSSIRGGRSLYIWSSLGGLINIVPLQFMARSDWSPLWHPDEKSVSLFYRQDFTKKSDPILQHTVHMQEYGVR